MNKRPIDKILIKPDEKLLDPKHDIVFKSMLTMKTDESRFALENIITAFTGRKASQIQVAENEPQGGNTKGKRARLDINCVLDGKHLANIEMTMNAQESEFVRLEQYIARLFGNCSTKGINYDNYPDAYQISIIGNKNLTEDDDVVTLYEMCNVKSGLSANGKMHIITAELKKIRENKQLEEMDSKERWSAFLAWFGNKTKLDKINKILSLEEGIAMATEALRKTSADELIRMELDSKEHDEEIWGNRLANAKAEGLSQRNIEIAKEMLAEGFIVEQIAKITKLSIEEIEGLRN